MRKIGRELWKVQIADVAEGETVTMAPLVVKDRVIVGASGGEFGIYGWLKGLDLQDRADRLDGAQHRARCGHAGAGRTVQAALRGRRRRGREQLGQ